MKITFDSGALGLGEVTAVAREDEKGHLESYFEVKDQSGFVCRSRRYTMKKTIELCPEAQLLFIRNFIRSLRCMKEQQVLNDMQTREEPSGYSLKPGMTLLDEYRADLGPGLVMEETESVTQTTP